MPKPPLRRFLGRSSRDTAGPWPVWLWHPDHQPLIACLAIAILATAGWLGWSLIRQGGSVVDIDRAPKKTYRFQVNINSASQLELQAIPGIGPQLARRIVEHREQHGPFSDTAQLTDVPGIGPKTLARIDRYLLPFGDSADR